MKTLTKQMQISSLLFGPKRHPPLNVQLSVIRRSLSPRHPVERTPKAPHRARANARATLPPFPRANLVFPDAARRTMRAARASGAIAAAARADRGVEGKGMGRVRAASLLLLLAWDPRVPIGRERAGGGNLRARSWG